MAFPVLVPTLLVTVTAVAPPVPAGTFAVSLVSERTVNDEAFTSPNFTALSSPASRLRKPLPEIVTVVPPAVEPEDGETEFAVGALVTVLSVRMPTDGAGPAWVVSAAAGDEASVTAAAVATVSAAARRAFFEVAMVRSLGAGRCHRGRLRLPLRCRPGRSRHRAKQASISSGETSASVAGCQRGRRSLSMICARMPSARSGRRSIAAESRSSCSRARSRFGSTAADRSDRSVIVTAVGERVAISLAAACAPAAGWAASRATIAPASSPA